MTHRLLAAVMMLSTQVGHAQVRGAGGAPPESSAQAERQLPQRVRHAENSHARPARPASDRPAAQPTRDSAGITKLRATPAPARPAAKAR